MIELHRLVWNCESKKRATVVLPIFSPNVDGLLWLPYAIGQAIIFASCGFSFLSSSFFFFLTYSQPSQIGCLLYFHTWCDPSANLGCRPETCCTWLPEMQDAKKITKNSPSRHHRTTLSGHIFATKAHIDSWKKNLLNSISLPQVRTIWWTSAH